MCDFAALFSLLSLILRRLPKHGPLWCVALLIADHYAVTEWNRDALLPCSASALYDSFTLSAHRALTSDVLWKLYVVRLQRATRLVTVLREMVKRPWLSSVPQDRMLEGVHRLLVQAVADTEACLRYCPANQRWRVFASLGRVQAILGFRGMARAIIGTLCTSVSADFFSIFPPAASDPLLCALVGGAVMGVGAGIMLGSGVTTGGSDLAAYLLRKKLPAIPTGRLILYFDTVIILAAAIALGSLRGVMYSVVCTVAYSAALDMVQSAARRAKTVFIISREYASIADAASSSLDRGTTLLRGIGWHTGEEWNVVMCVIAKQQEYTLREIVRGADPSAFIVICDASCVLGEGFMHGDDE